MYNICERQVLVPQSLKIPLNYDATKNPLCQGMHSDVWKTQYSGKAVAVRVLRVHSTSDDPEIRSVGDLGLSSFVVYIDCLPHLLEILRDGHRLGSP